MSDHVSVETSDHVTTVTLLGRTMTPGFFTECERLFTEIGREIGQGSEVRAVVIRGQGKAFSYGLDLPAAFGEYGPIMTGNGLAAQRTELLGLIRRLQRSFTAVESCPVPVIAAIHGWCIGGGLDLVSACDIRLASRDARISLRETRIAIVADLGSLQRLPAIIGQGNTRELAFTGKDIDGERALGMGLVNELHDDHEALWRAAGEMAAVIASNPPLTVRGVKEVLDYGKNKSVADGLEYVAAWNSAFLASHDLGEAVAAFTQKRPPRFEGK